MGFLAALASHIDTRVEFDRLSQSTRRTSDGKVVSMEAYVDNAAMLAALAVE